MSERMVSEVCEVVGDVFGLHPESLNQDTSPQSVEAWDSLRHLDVVMALEQRFGVRFSPDEIASMKDVRSIAVCIGKKAR